MIDFLTSNKSYTLFLLLTFCYQSILPSQVKKERKMGWGTMIFGRNSNSEIDDDEETLLEETATANQKPNEIKKDSQAISIQKLGCSNPEVKKNVDDFEMVDEPVSPNFLQNQPIPKQSNAFSQSTIGLRESYLDYMRRILQAGQQEDAMTKDANYGVNASRALFDSVQKLTELNSAQDLSVLELLKSQRAQIIATHSDCDMLIQAVNQRCSFCKSKLAAQSIATSKNQSTSCTGCTYGTKHITPKHIEDGQKALRAAQVAHLNNVAKFLKDANDRLEAIHQLRVDLYKAHPTPEQTRPVSPLHRMELVQNPNKNN